MAEKHSTNNNYDNYFYIWRPPTPEERDLRMIFGRQHVWNPRRRGWEDTKTHTNTNTNTHKDNKTANLRPAGRTHTNGNGNGNSNSNTARRNRSHRYENKYENNHESSEHGNNSGGDNSDTKTTPPLDAESAGEYRRRYDHHHHHHNRHNNRHYHHQRTDASHPRKRKRVAFDSEHSESSPRECECECESPAPESGSPQHNHEAEPATATAAATTTPPASASASATMTTTAAATTKALTPSKQNPLDDDERSEWKRGLQNAMDENRMLSQRFHQLREQHGAQVTKIREQHRARLRKFRGLEAQYHAQSKVLESVSRSKEVLIQSAQKERAALTARIRELEDSNAAAARRRDEAPGDRPEGESFEPSAAVFPRETTQKQTLRARLEATKRELAAATARDTIEEGERRRRKLLEEKHAAELSAERDVHQTALQELRAEKEAAEGSLEDLQHDNDVYSKRLREALLRVGILEASDRAREVALQKCQKDLEDACQKKEEALAAAEARPPKEEKDHRSDPARDELEQNYAKLQVDFNTLAMQVSRQSRTIEEQHRKLRRWNERLGPHGVVWGSDPKIPLKIED